MFRGKRYRISCDDLGAPRTKEGSYHKANAWWALTRQELTQVKMDEERQARLDDIHRKLDYAANYDPKLTPHLEATRQEIIDNPPTEIILDDVATIEENKQLAEMVGIIIPPDLDPEVGQQIFGDRRMWQERLSRTRATETNKTVGHQLERFLKELRHTQKPKTHLEISTYLKGLLGTVVWAKETAVEMIDEQTVNRHHDYLVARDLASVSHNKYLGFFRRFVSWLHTEGLLPKGEPKNLKKKTHRKKKTHKIIKTWNGIPSIVEALPQPRRLWALLGLNCGCTAADLGSLTWEHIDQNKWILTRLRVKTQDNPNTPTVAYKLWPETIAELERLPHREGLLFVTRDGNPMYETKYLENGKPTKKDLFSDYWQDLSPPCPITLGKFRSVGSTALKADKYMRAYIEYFLGHAASKTADEVYSAEHDNPFFEALAFIRSQLGFGKTNTQNTPNEAAPE